MTTEELCAEIERLDAAATAGPWSYEKDWFSTQEGNVWCIEDVAGLNLVLAKVPIEENAQGNSEDDAQLIASYRTLAVEAAKKLREMQRRDEVIGKLLANPDWHRQMAGSIEFFENGGEGKPLVDLGLE